MSQDKGLLSRARLIPAFPPVEVRSSEGTSEQDPAAAGLLRGDVEAIWQEVERLYQTRMHPAIALCVRRRGVVVLDRAIGHVSGNEPDAPSGGPRVQATPKTLFNIFSASKAVTAMLVHLLNERGLLHLDDPVAEYLPEFGKHGKEGVSVRHLLTHRAGIPNLPTERIDLDLLTRPEEIVALLCEAKPLAPAGRKLAYHALTGGWIQGALIERVTGRALREVIRAELAEPLGLEHFGYGTSPERLGEVARHAFTGAPLVQPARMMLKRALGVDFEDAVKFSNDPRFLTSVVPAGNVIATAEGVCRFFEMLLRGGAWGERRIFERRTIQRACAEQEYLNVDATFGVPIRYSMGFVLGGKLASIYGPDTEACFGHLGFTTITAWADPARDVSACLMTTGKHFLDASLWRHLQVLRAIHARCPKVA